MAGKFTADGFYARLEITTRPEGLRFCAAAANLTGSPPLGRGSSRAEAIGDLIINLAADKHYTKSTPTGTAVDIVITTSQEPL